MKKIIIVLVLLAVVGRLPAQVLVNGDFSSVCSTPPAGGCVSDFLQNPCVDNWFHVTGAPYVFGSFGSYHSVILRSSYTFTPLSLYATGLHGAGPGSQGIAASYAFLKGSCYKVTLVPGSAAKNSCKGSSTTLEVWAANGLTQPAGVPTCIGSAPSTPSSFEKIGIKTYAPGEIGDLTPIVFNYTATKNNSQILIFVRQNSECTQIVSTSPMGEPDVTATIRVGLEFDLKKVSIEFRECKDDCKDDEWLVNHSSQIAAGGLFKHSGIRAGGSVASGGDPVVSPPVDKNTMLMGSFIELRNNFKAVVDATHFFSATPARNCKCTLVNPILSTSIHGFEVRVGCTLLLVDSTAGGVWSGNDNDRATIDPVTGLVTGINSSIGGSGDVDITYTVGGCSTTVRIRVVPAPACGCCLSKDAPENPITATADNESIQVFPNPAQSSITISYPCNANKQMQINIKDVSGRSVYAENVPCDGESTMLHQVNISTLPAGMYIVELMMDAQHTVRKLVKL